MLRTIVTILLVVTVMETVTVTADAEWEMSEFPILLGWASLGDHPDDAAKMAAIADAGFNTVMWYNAGVLDLSHLYGLKQLIQVKPPTLISDWHRQHPANWGYYVGDEPPPPAYPAMAAEVDVIHQTDPDHPAYVNITGASDIEAFLDTVPVKLLSYTGIYQWWSYTSPYYRPMENSRTAGLDAGIPVMRWIEVNANPEVLSIEANNQGQWPPWSVTAPPPPDNAEKLRQSVYSSLAYGVKGIQWFTGAILFEHGTSNLNAIGTDVATLNWELQQLGPTLLGLESVDVFHTTPLPVQSFDDVRELPGNYWVQTDTSDLILGMFKDSQDIDYIMLNNRKIDESRQPVLSFPQTVTHVAQFDRGQGEWIDLHVTPLGGRTVVEFALAPGDGELLKVVAPADTATGLLNHWGFDDNAANNTVVDAVGGADGEYLEYMFPSSPDPPFTAPRNTNQGHSNDSQEGTGSLEFGGNVLPTQFKAEGLSYGGPSSVAFWFKPNINLNSVSGRMDIFSNLTPGTNNDQYSFLHNAVGGGEIEWRVGNTPTLLKSTTTTFSAGEWYHVAATIKEDVAALYINGVLEATIDPAGDMPESDEFSDLVMGSNGGSFNYDGLLDDVRIYERALSLEDVQELFTPSTDFTWDATSGDWNEAGNWSPSFNGAPPGNPLASNRFSHTATFGDSIGSDAHTVFTNQSVSVNAINFTNSMGGIYRIAGGPNIDLVASAETTPTLPSISVDAGWHEFQVAVRLQADTTVNVASGSTLDLNNRLVLTGNTLIKTGDGVLSINNDVVEGGGSIVLQQGTIAGNGTVGGDVINIGGILLPGSSAAVSAATIPEPAGILLIGLGFLMFVVTRRFGR